jgi:hypothetical protein
MTSLICSSRVSKCPDDGVKKCSHEGMRLTGDAGMKG